jgi:hypothetical protein
MRALQAKGSRHAILRFHANAARASIALGTLPQVVQRCFPDVQVKQRRQDGYFSLPNGSRRYVDLNPVGTTHWTNVLVGEKRETTAQRSG